MAFFTAMALIFEPMRRLSNIAGNFQVMLASAEKVFTFFQLNNLNYHQELNSEHIDATNFSGEIVFERVSFKIADKMILNEVTFSISPGELVAFVGKSGAGKTTILRLLSGMISPTSGRILIDGVDISSIPISRLRAHISIVIQENQLFDETIYENIRIGKLDATDAEIQQAGLSAFVNEFSDDLPEKLFTKVGPRGNKLSGGQRQRINIARALIRNSPIFLLDEPTASLDAKSEDLVQKALNRAISGRTTLIISHRIATIVNAQKVIVMDKGMIVDQGTHPELMKKKGLYFDLSKLQMLGG